VARRVRRPQSGLRQLVAETDSFTMLVGAHGGKPGAIVAAGTGSIGEVLRPDGTRFSVGGWGFPVSDEGGGAWLGMRAVRWRSARSTAAQRRHAGAPCLGTLRRDRDTLQAWCDQRRQFEYAQLAPRVFDAERRSRGAQLLARRGRRSTRSRSRSTRRAPAAGRVRQHRRAPRRACRRPCAAAWSTRRRPGAGALT
jgi:glucosamine kinase